MLEKKKLIVGIAHRDGAQLWYRLLNPLRVLEDAGIAECPVLCLDEDPDLSGLPSILEHADLVIWQNPSGTRDLNWIREIRENARVPVAVDMDDNNFAVTPDNESYIWWGRAQERIVKNPEGKTLAWWKAGKEYGDLTYDPKRNADTLRTQLSSMRAATAVICSTFRLQQDILRYKGWRLNRPGLREVPTYLCPNMIDSRLWPSIRVGATRPSVRILWQGGSSHLADLYLIREQLAEVLFRCPEATFVVFGGPRNRDFLIGLPRKQVEVQEAVDDGDAYREKLSDLDCDIGLAPLRDTPFNRCKSAVKFLQYTMLGIPTIASDVPPYSDTIEFDEGDGRAWTGVLADEYNSWVEGLTQLVKLPEMRFTLAKNARNWVRWHGDTQSPQVIENLRALYGGICGLRNDVPGARDPARLRRI